MGKPVIGLTIQYRYEDDRFQMSRYYADAIAAAGGAPLLLPEMADEADAALYVSLCDGFLFTGGADIDPARYGAAMAPECGAIAPSRDAFEFMLFRHAYASRRPMLGICRGAQVMNVALGGSMHQHITGHTGVGTYVWHPAQVEAQSLLHRALGVTALDINSGHHQAIARVGDGLRVTARAADGTVEAIEDPAHPFFLGVQWHPEASWFLDHEARYSPTIFRSFIQACCQ